VGDDGDATTAAGSIVRHKAWARHYVAASCALFAYVYQKITLDRARHLEKADENFDDPAWRTTTA
jgi:hypothetical protein